VFSLARWSSRFQSGFLLSRPTQDPAKSLRNFAYGALTLSGLSFQIILLSLQVLYRSPTTPTGKPAGLGSFLFARRYLGNRFFFLFLQLLRCFRSLRLPSLTLTVNDNTSRYWVPPIRISPDHCLLTAPRSLSWFVTSFIGFSCQGIHHAPFST